MYNIHCIRTLLYITISFSDSVHAARWVKGGGSGGIRQEFNKSILGPGRHSLKATKNWCWDDWPHWPPFFNSTLTHNLFCSISLNDPVLNNSQPIFTNLSPNDPLFRHFIKMFNFLSTRRFLYHDSRPPLRSHHTFAIIVILD